jgi:hypothetical protein
MVQKIVRTLGAQNVNGRSPNETGGSALKFLTIRRTVRTLRPAISTCFFTQRNISLGKSSVVTVTDCTQCLHRPWQYIGRVLKLYLNFIYVSYTYLVIVYFKISVRFCINDIYWDFSNRQVAGSIPDGVIGIFQWHNSSGRTMALGSTQPLTKMIARCISLG